MGWVLNGRGADSENQKSGSPRPDILRTATVIQIKQDALEAAALVATPRRSKRTIMVVPQRSIGRVSRYLVLQRC